jgi:FkbH-like protein
VIVIAATFVSEPLKSPLAWLLEQAGLKEEIRFAPYNQVFQQLLSPASNLSRDSNGINILLIRLEDFTRDAASTLDACRTLERVTCELIEALATFAAQAENVLMLAVLPPGPSVASELREEVTRASSTLVARAHDLPGIHLLEGADLEIAAPADPYDSTRDRLAHIPYTDAYFAALALVIARRIHAIRVPAAKVLALDCDNTLWHGVVGEDGVDGISITGGYLDLQAFGVAQQAKGVLLCIVSKNLEADVLEVLKRRQEMKLNESHVVAHRINWQPKPANLRSLAAELNLGLDSFVFMDDSPVECAQMRAELPQVITLQLPPEPEIAHFLRHLWVFDTLVTTAEDANRTRMYRENAARRNMESSMTHLGEFLAALDLRIDIAVPSEDEWSRVAQLTQRTNQFNFTTRRRTTPELKELVANGAYVLRVRVSDRFGDYGLVGVLVADGSSSSLRVDTLLLSCRVLGRGVEHAMLRRLGELAERSHLDDVVLPYVQTARNVPARAFAESVAREFAEPQADRILYRIPAARAAAVVHRPGNDPDEVIEARAADEKKRPVEARVFAGDRSERYARLARMPTGESLLQQMAARERSHRLLGGTPAPPTSDTEVGLLHLWEEVLETSGLGVEDNFFALGGTSLQCVILFAEVEHRFSAQLSPTDILDAPTVRQLARLIATSGARESGGIVSLHGGGLRKLFLVHDGLGETLLYLNLAKRLPAGLSVYGIEPRRVPGVPLAHASIEDMAAYYVAQIRQLQPRGPYLLGGMCAGGVIAYEMAACLRRVGEQVEMVAILDGATPQAAKRAGRTTQQRMERLKDTFRQDGSPPKAALSRWLSICGSVGRKARGALMYEISSRLERVTVRLRFVLLESVVRRAVSWPAMVPSLSVMQIYNSLESRYRPPTLANVPVLLVRASVGVGTDTPYREIYTDEDFGWRAVAQQLELVNVRGGHASMLQEQFVDSLAHEIAKRVRLAAEPLPELVE